MAREWMLQEARAKRASLEAVVKAVIVGTKVEYRAGQFPRSTSLPALVLSDDGSMDFGGLTAQRCKAALPFAGKYRLIDFALSNCVNSEIEIVGVITQYQPRSLTVHLSYGRAWNLDRRRVGARSKLCVTIGGPALTC